MTIYSLDVLLSWFGTSSLFHVWFCFFLTCIHVSQESGQVVWYFHHGRWMESQVSSLLLVGDTACSNTDKGKALLPAFELLRSPLQGPWTRSATAPHPPVSPKQAEGSPLSHLPRPWTSLTLPFELLADPCCPLIMAQFTHLHSVAMGQNFASTCWQEFSHAFCHFNLPNCLLLWFLKIWMYLGYFLRNLPRLPTPYRNTSSILRVSVQFSSVTQLCWLFVIPWTAECQASLSITNYWSLL